MCVFSRVVCLSKLSVFTFVAGLLAVNETHAAPPGIVSDYAIEYANDNYYSGTPRSLGSGVTRWPSRNSYLVLDNTVATYGQPPNQLTGTRLVEYRADHTVWREIVLVGFQDPEDIHWISGNSFVIAQEYNTGPSPDSANELVVIELPTSANFLNITDTDEADPACSDGCVRRRVTFPLALLDDRNNKGIEAVARLGAKFYFTTEYAPLEPANGWKVWSIPYDPADSSSGQVPPTPEFQLPVSGIINDMKDISGMATDGTHLWLLSHEGSGSEASPVASVIKVTTAGSLIAEYLLPNFCNGDIWRWAEGIELFTDPSDNVMRILLSGEIGNFGGIGVDFMKLSAAGGLIDPCFNPGTDANAEVITQVIQPIDEKIIIGGTFTQVNGVNRNFIARLLPGGGLDSTFNPLLNSWVDALAVQSDGKILVGGYFTEVNGQPRNVLVRLNPGGTTDSAPFVTGDAIYMYDVAIQPDGKIIAVGAFPNAGFVARYWPDGTLENGSISTDAPFNYTVKLQADGKILIGGQFYNVLVNGTPYSRRCIARLNADFTLDHSFTPTLDSGESELISIALQPDNKILIAGWFDLVNGVPRYGITRLDNWGNLDDTFTTFPSEFNSVESVVYSPSDAKIYIGGWFVNGIARLNLDGALDTAFNLGTGLQKSPWTGYANAIVQQTDSKIIVGGGFSTYNGTSRNNIVRMHGN